MLTNDERRQLIQMLRDRDTQKDATIIWLCEVALDLNKRLGEIRAIVNRK